jgi:hypothetical protein
MFSRLHAAARSTRELIVQRLPITDAPAHELGPVGHGRKGVLPLGQQSPQRGVMPAELVLAAVPMRADALSQLPGFGDELLAGQPFQVFVHRSQCSAGLPGMMMVLPGMDRMRSSIASPLVIGEN